jgi:hypothetical protein
MADGIFNATLSKRRRDREKTAEGVPSFRLGRQGDFFLEAKEEHRHVKARMLDRQRGRLLVAKIHGSDDNSSNVCFAKKTRAGFSFSRALDATDFGLFGCGADDFHSKRGEPFDNPRTTGGRKPEGKEAAMRREKSNFHVASFIGLGVIRVGQHHGRDFAARGELKW